MREALLELRIEHLVVEALQRRTVLRFHADEDVRVGRVKRFSMLNARDAQSLQSRHT